MSFHKTSSVATISVATNDGSGFKRSAAYGDSSSAFLDGNRKIDVKAALDIIASEYDISAEPGDYIFEVIRGNTVNVPNENSDAFHKHELLRFDHRLGKQVYRTYELKPHQINHRAENPKNARGFIVDAHYNDLTPPLESCPECNNKTADRSQRDVETGIHCIKCGTVVKDEYVELLVAIDTKKDPTFAQGVMSGVLKHGSMGCSCMRTRCNVCGNVAYTRAEFCAHIRNKGKTYDETEANFNPVAAITKYSESNGKQAGKPRRVAKAHEWCEGVIYEEYSRVHDPADPKAEQAEILRMTAQIQQLQSTDKIRHESEILTLQAKVSQLEKILNEKLGKVAQKRSDVVINIGQPGAGPEDVNIESDEPLEEGAGTPIEEMTPEDLGLTPAPEGEQLTPAAMGIMPPPGPTNPPGAVPLRGGSKLGKSAQQALEALGGPSMYRFADSYKNLKAEATAAGNIRVFDNEGTLFVVKPADKTAKLDDFAKSILVMVAEEGLGAAIQKTSAIMGPRLAQVLEFHVDDMTDDRNPESGSVLEDAQTDSVEQRTRDKKTQTATGTGETTDAQDKRDKKDVGDDVLTDRQVDVEDEVHNRDPSKLNVTDMQDTDMREKRPDFNLSQSILDNEAHDHKDKLAAKQIKTAGACRKCGHDSCPCGGDPMTGEGCKCTGSYSAARHAARIEEVNKARLERRIAELEKEQEDFKKHYAERFTRAMKIVARRQALNLEASPIKEAIADALLSPRSLGGGYEYNPMDPHTATVLTEVAYTEPVHGGVKPAWEDHVDTLIARTAEVMAMGDETLMQTEADLKNLRVAKVVPDITPTAEAPIGGDSDLRTAAARGNLQLSPSGIETAMPAGNGKREAIRKAVGETKVASLAAGGFGR